MNAIESFNQIIEKIFPNYLETEEMDYQTFSQNFSFWTYNVNIKLKNKNTQKIEYESSNLYDIFSLGDFEELSQYTFVVEHSAVKYLDDIILKVKEHLANDFDTVEYQDIIGHMADRLWSLSKNFKAIKNPDPVIEEIIYYLDFIQKSSLDQIVDEFNDNPEFENLVLTNYCSDYIELKEDIYRNNENNILYVQSVNEYIRNKIFYLIDNLSAMGYTDEACIDFLGEYLSSSFSIGTVDQNLANIMYNGYSEEYQIKKYMVYIVIYDFYKLASNPVYSHNVSQDDAMFVDFIEHSNLEDIFILFFKVKNFRKAALEYFELLNMFEEEDILNHKVNENIQKKFSLIYRIDSLFKQKI